MATDNHEGESRVSVVGFHITRRRTALKIALVLCVVLSCTAASAQGVRIVEPAPRTLESAGHTKILAPGAVVSDVLSINPFAFEGLEASDIDALQVLGVGRFCERMDALPCLIEAPVALATGTTVTRLELDAVDSGPSFVKANFYRCPIGASACTLLAEVSTEGTPGATQVGVDLALPESIDNRIFTYLVEVFPGDDGMTRLVGARLVLVGPESTALSEVLSLHAYAFEGRTPADRTASRASSVQRYCTGTACTLMAPIELPSGATVTRIELDAIDNGPADIAAEFSRCDAASGNCVSVASLSTSGAPGATQPGFDLLSPEIVDNVGFTYRVEVSLGATNDTRLLGLRLLFNQPPPLSKGDRLSISPFAFEGLDADDHGVMNASGGERFCDGQSCTMAAPVELPSGTKVERLELSGLDTSAETDLRATILRCPEGFSTCSEVATVATVGIPGAKVEGVDLGTPEVIDNLLFTYLVEVQGGPNAATSLRTVSLSIERALIFSDGFGTGNDSRWSQKVP